MTGNQTDGATLASGQGGEPNQPSSPAQSKPFDGDATQLLGSLLDQKLTERFTAFEKTFADRVGRAQGAADHSTNAVRELAARLEQFEKKGMSREEALTAIEQTDAESSWRQNLEKKLDDILAGRIASGGTQANRQQSVTEVFASKGLDVQDPRLAQFLVKQYKSPEEMELAAYRLKDELAKTPNPNPAQSASMQGGQSASSVQAKIERLSTLQQDPLRNQKEIKALTAELDAVDWK